MSGVTPFVVAVATAFAGTQPQLTAVGNQVYVTFGHGDTISVARSADGGKSFGAPVALPSQGRLSLGMHRGPRIAGTGRALLVAAVVGSRGGGADGDVVLFRSSDRGATWSSPIVINDVAGAAREGLHALAASPSGLVVAAWLDLRHGGTRIYAAVSRDHGASWAADRLVYSSPGGSVCECCHPSVAISGAGEIAVMFRNSIDGNRDLYAARSARGATFAPASKLGISSWALKACPMDGGAVAFDGANIAAIWRRENNVFLTTAKAPEQRLARGRDPALSQRGSHRDMAWNDGNGVTLARGAAAPIPLGPGRFPSVLALPAATVIAWEHQGQISVRAVPR